jgi:glycosyltransferase involved in cell wall biosynthesis
VTQKISVALCTFNGQPFLEDQLASLRAQSRQPDELIVCDDHSADATIDLLSNFARTAPFPVEIQQNAFTLGPAQNFAKAIDGCGGDIISLCDQDDIWEPSKLEQTQAAFDRNPGLGFVFTDAEICDPACQPLGYRLWTSVGFAPAEQAEFSSGKGFDVLLKHNVVTGATLSFASRFRSLILPVPTGWMHDGWTALLLSAVASGLPISAPLMRYRQHPSQSIGAARRSLYQQYLNAKMMGRQVFADQANEYESALTRLQEQTDYSVPPPSVRSLQQKILHCRRRSAIRLGQTSRLFPALGEWVTGRYGRFSLGWKSLAQDMLL